MSKVIRLSDSTWAALAAFVGVSPESLTDRHARRVIDQLVCRMAAPALITAGEPTSADQLLAAYRTAPDSHGWLNGQKNANLKRLARKLRVITKDTIDGRYYRKDELIALILGASLPALLRG